MPKRFTDTEKWKKPFLRGLKAPYKLLWFYIVDECDHAGIWQVDFEVAQIKIGEKLNEADALKFFLEKIVILDGGTKWFIPSFIEFQYGQLQAANRAHTRVISVLNKHNLLDINFEIKPLTSPLRGGKEKEEEKEEYKEKEQVKEKGAKYEFVYGFESENFKHIWSLWKEHLKAKKKEYKSVISEQAAMNKLMSLSGGDENSAIELATHAMACNWQAFFPINNFNNGTAKPKQGTAKTGNDIVADELAAKYGGNNGHG